MPGFLPVNVLDSGVPLGRTCKLEGTIEGGGNSEDIDGRGRDRCVVMLGDRGYVVWSNARRDRRACCASVGRGGFGVGCKRR